MTRLCFVLAIAACGGDSNTSSPDASSSNVVTGTVQGMTFSAMDAIAKTFAQTNGFSFQGPASFVEMTDYPGACAAAGQDKVPATSHIFDLAMAVDDASGNATAPTATGTFTVFSSANPLPASMNVAQVFFSDGCDKNLAYEGKSGTITLTNVSPPAGTFDLMISCQGFSSCTGADAHLTGSFSSTACADLNVDTIPACQ